MIIKCPYCGSEATVKFGKYKDSQYYYCKLCCRKFRDNEYLYHMKVPRRYITRALEMYYTGYSVPSIREFLSQNYGYSPSYSVLWGWINKYTRLAVSLFRDVSPVTGKVWIVTETMLEMKRQKLFVYDVLDKETRFLFISCVGVHEVVHAVREFLSGRGDSPEKVYINVMEPYEDAIRNIFDRCREFSREPQFNGNNEFIDRFSLNLPDGSRVLRNFRSINILVGFIMGWRVYYNFFRLNPRLGDKTPAQMCGLDYHIKTWDELIRKTSHP